MLSRRMVAIVLAAALIGGVFALSCGGKSSSPTNPAAPELNSGDIANGAAFAHTFNTAGSFSYHCVHHANMTGTVNVAASGSPTTPSLIMVTSQPFGVTNVAVGSTVTWTNSSGAIHTVTSD